MMYLKNPQEIWLIIGGEDIVYGGFLKYDEIFQPFMPFSVSQQ